MPVTLPTTVNTANTDASTDDPKQMRADLLDLMQKFNTLLGQVNSLGIMQPGEGVEQLANGAGVKDALRVKLDGASLARGASGLRIADDGVTGVMLDNGSNTPGASKYYGTNGSSTFGFFSLPAGIVLQVLYSRFATYTNNTSGTTLPRDNTTPLNTEGVQAFSQAITLANAANKVRIGGKIVVGASSALTYGVAIFRGSTCIWAGEYYSGGAEIANCNFETYDAPGSTGPHTYSLRVGTGGGSSFWFNGGSAQFYNGTLFSDFALMEFV